MKMPSNKVLAVFTIIFASMAAYLHFARVNASATATQPSATEIAEMTKELATAEPRSILIDHYGRLTIVIQNRGDEFLFIRGLTTSWIGGDERVSVLAPKIQMVIRPSDQNYEDWKLSVFNQLVDGKPATQPASAPAQ